MSRMTLNCWSSYSYLSRTGITDVYHHTGLGIILHINPLDGPLPKIFSPVLVDIVALGRAWEILYIFFLLGIQRRFLLHFIKGPLWNLGNAIVKWIKQKLVISFYPKYLGPVVFSVVFLKVFHCPSGKDHLVGPLVHTKRWAQPLLHFVCLCEVFPVGCCSKLKLLKYTVRPSSSTMIPGPERWFSG